jgi:hypothetical protein
MSTPLYPVTVNPAYVEAASYLPRAERERRHGLVDLAIRQGAKQGPESIWPDPAVRVPVELRTSPEIVHWIRHSLRLTPQERAALRTAIAQLPAHAAPMPEGLRRSPEDLIERQTRTGGRGRFAAIDAQGR